MRQCLVEKVLFKGNDVNMDKNKPACIICGAPCVDKSLLVGSILGNIGSIHCFCLAEISSNAIRYIKFSIAWPVPFVSLILNTVAILLLTIIIVPILYNVLIRGHTGLIPTLILLLLFDIYVVRLTYNLVRFKQKYHEEK